MVNGVGTTPKSYGVSVSTPITQPAVVGAAMMKEGTMPAVVLDHEKPHEKACGRNGEQEA
jgi:hypothetical protein